MPTNEFLPFATGVGANVLSQADYAALGARGTGFVAGTALSAPFNKAVRQSSVAASMAAQFSADMTGADVTDDGSVSTILNIFKAAIRSQKLNYLTAGGGTASAVSISLTPAPSAWVDLVGTPLRLAMGTAAGAPATLAVAGLAGTRPIVKRGGAPVLPNEWLAGDIVECVYDGTVVRMISSQRLGLDSAGFSSYGTNLNIPISDVGKLINFNLACTAVTLPKASDAPFGIMVLHNTTQGNLITVNAAAGDDITVGLGGAGSGITSFNMEYGESAFIASWSPFANNWAVMLGSVQDRYRPQFQSALGTTGWKRTPDPVAPRGFIMDQWGEVTVSAANTLQAVTLPVTFTTSIMEVTGNSASNGAFAGASGLNLSQFYVFSSVAGSLVRWRARGY